MNRGALTLLGLAAAAAGAWWYFGRQTAQTSADGQPNTTALDTSSWGLGASLDSASSTVQDSLASIGDSIMNVFQPRGIRNNNPLNLRYIADPARAWNGQTGDDGGYGIYSSPALGVRAASKQLQEDYSRNGDTTLAALITTWAPPTENDTAAYIADVAQRTGLDPNAPLDLYGNLPAIVNAMIFHENGQNPYLFSDIQQWVYLS